MFCFGGFFLCFSFDFLFANPKQFAGTKANSTQCHRVQRWDCTRWTCRHIAQGHHTNFVDNNDWYPLELMMGINSTRSLLAKKNTAAFKNKSKVKLEMETRETNQTVFFLALTQCEMTMSFQLLDYIWRKLRWEVKLKIMSNHWLYCDIRCPKKWNNPHVLWWLKIKQLFSWEKIKSSREHSVFEVNNSERRYIPKWPKMVVAIMVIAIMWHYDIPNRTLNGRTENCKSILHDWHIIYTNANDSLHSI